MTATSLRTPCSDPGKTMSVPRIILCGAIVAALAVLVEPALGQQPLAQQRPDSSLIFSGEVRTRAEYDRPGSGLGGDGVTLLRSRFGADARLAGGARMFVQIQDSRVFGEKGTTSGSADQLDLHQGYLELNGKWEGRGVGLRAGRQEIALGNERLVGAVGWTNTGRSFDGARVDLTAEGATWHATALAATLAEHGRRSPARVGDDPARDDETLLGLAINRGTFEALLVHDRGVHFRVFDQLRRTTGYVRYRTPSAAGFVMDLEGAYQTGSQRRLPTGGSGSATDQDIGAWFAGARVNRPADSSLPASLTLGVDWLSGDSDPADGNYGAFNTLYATNHKWYGIMDLFLDPAARTGDRGLVDATAGAAMTLSPRVALRADVHHFRTAAAGAGAVDRALGWEGDLTMPVRVSQAASIELGYALFRPGAGGQALGLGDEGVLRHWGYLQLRVGF